MKMNAMLTPLADIRQRILEGLATTGNDSITGFDGNDTIPDSGRLSVTRESRRWRYGDNASANVEWRVAA